MKVLVFKKLSLELPPLKEGEAICPRNRFILHGAYPEHTCTMEIVEVDMTQEELDACEGKL